MYNPNEWTVNSKMSCTKACVQERLTLGPEGRGGPRRFSTHRLSGSNRSGFKSLTFHSLTQWSGTSSFHFLSLFPNLWNGDDNPTSKGWCETGMHRNWHIVGGQQRLAALHGGSEEWDPSQLASTGISVLGEAGPHPPAPQGKGKGR